MENNDAQRKLRNDAYIKLRRLQDTIKIDSSYYDKKERFNAALGMPYSTSSGSLYVIGERAMMKHIDPDKVVALAVLIFT